MSKETSIFNAIYYGGVTPWEGTSPRTKEQQKQAEKSCALHDKLLSMLGEEGKALFEEFLTENVKVTGYFEEEKFKDGFILGARLMIETLLDPRFSGKKV